MVLYRKEKKQKHLATEFSLTFLSPVCTIMNFMLVCHFRELRLMVTTIQYASRIDVNLC